MSNPAKVLKGTSLLVKVGDGADPETFIHPCLINTARSIDFSAGTNTQGTPDCDDPEAVNWDSVEVVSKSATITGAGVLHTPNYAEWFDWFDSGEAKNCRVEFSGVTNLNGGGWHAGAFKCTGLSVTGDKGSKTEISVTLVADGRVTWVPAA